jgi:hypothetical protein
MVDQSVHNGFVLECSPLRLRYVTTEGNEKMAEVGFEPGTSSDAKVMPAGENTKHVGIEAIAGMEEDWEALGLNDSLVEGVERIMGERSGEGVVTAVTGEAESLVESNDERVETGRWAGVSSGLEETVTTQTSSSHAEILDAEVCGLLSAVCCLLSAVCCLLSAVCYLHSPT